jgi:hypothetical protein
MRAIMPFLFIMIAVLTVPLWANEGEMVCPVCSTINVQEAVFCKNCGARIKKEEKRPRPEANHLFTVSTAHVLPSLEIQLAGGGAYGLESEQTFLGNIGIGLGGVAELNLSTYSLFNNLGRQSATIPTSLFKLRIVGAKNNRPAVAVGFRISSSQLYENNSVGFAVPADAQGRDLASMNYETRFTECNINATLPRKKTQTTVSLRVLDIRFSNLSSNWKAPGYGSNDTVRRNPAIDKDKPNYFLSFGLGSEIELNPQTKLLLEIASLPLYDLEKAIKDDKAVEFKTIFALTGGVRFYFTDWLYINSGVKYQSDYNGLADLNLRAELNIFVPTLRLIKSIK